MSHPQLLKLCGGNLADFETGNNLNSPNDMLFYWMQTHSLMEYLCLLFHYHFNSCRGSGIKGGNSEHVPRAPAF